MAPLFGMFSGVPAPQTGAASPTGLPADFMQDWTTTWPFDWKVIFHASTVGTSCTMPPAPAALRMSTSDARKLLKLIGDLITERIVPEAYFWAPFIIVTAPVMLPSA